MDPMNVKYQFWKQFTYELLQSDLQIDRTYRGPGTAGQIVDLIESELRRDLRHGQPGLVNNVALCALDMYRTLNLSSKDWTITFDHPLTGQLSGFPFDEDFMVVEGSVTKGPVDLVLEPLLRYRGDTQGMNYDHITKVANMKVLVDWSTEHPTQGGWLIDT